MTGHTSAQSTAAASPRRRLLTRYLRPHRRALAALAALLLAGILFRLVGPLFAAEFVNLVVSPSPDAPSTARLTLPALAFCAAGVLDQLCLVGATALGSQLAWRATNRLREDLTAHALDLDTEFHHHHSPGTMLERIDGDARELNNFFSHFALQVVVNLAVVLGVVAVVFALDWRLGLVHLAFAVLAAVVFRQVRGRATGGWLRVRDALTDQYTAAEEIFGGLPDIRANGAEPHIRERLTAGLRRVFVEFRRAVLVGTGLSTGSGAVLVLGSTAVLGTGVALFLAGDLALGSLLALAMYGHIVNGPLRAIVDQLDDLQRSTASIDRVTNLLARRSAVPRDGRALLPPGALPVTFEEVSFIYPNQPTKPTTPVTRPALDTVFFTLAPGEVLGLVGRTGSGKSTLARLLLRFYDPSAGRLILGGHDLRDADPESLRRSVGAVAQDVRLFCAPVRDNLTLFRRNAPDAELLRVLDAVGLGAWAAALPDGLDTVLPPGGGLSAGQAQLLAAARVFLTDPGLVVLDEPTSRLDPATETALRTAFDRLLQGRTAVVIAHRLETLERADTVMVLEDGRAVEYGPRQVLAADPGSAYHRALALLRAEAASC